MRKIILTLVMMLFATQAWAGTVHNLPAEIALKKLTDGNERFSKYEMKHPNVQKARREKLFNAQHPYAIILACSDSTVPPEIIFDQGLGDVLVIRNAGNVVDEKTMANIEYAVRHYGINLVVVLGHEFCSIVGSAMKDDKESPLIENLKASIFPAISNCKDNNNYSYSSVIKTNAVLNATEILENKDLIEYTKKHDLKIIPAYYSVVTGKVEFIKM